MSQSLPAAEPRFMRRALALAARGEGRVEPNPLVGCVVVREGKVVGEGFHSRYGGPHAEVAALQAAGEAARGADLYVTLEPCCHQGKTPPCTSAVIAAGVRRVIAAMEDPYPHVAGKGFAQLNAAGIAAEGGLCEADARRLNAPYLMLLGEGRPWVIAKWAMTLDGKIATAAGDSRWISNEVSRAVVHRLRGRVDGVLVGGRTALCDDPLLTPRPPGPRTPLRIVLDPRAELSPDSRLAATARAFPTLLAVEEAAPPHRLGPLRDAGCEILPLPGDTRSERLAALLEELGRRRHTNLLVEGGGRLLASLFEREVIDEVHVFLGPKLIGGAAAPTPLAGAGIPSMAEARGLHNLEVRVLGGDLYLRGRLR